jgi:type II secretory pathway pseudopilin PulG
VKRLLSFLPIGSSLRNRSLPGGRRGFTLLELIIYIGVASLVLIGIISLFTLLAQQWLRGRARAAVEEDVRIVTERMRTEVESANAILAPQYKSVVLGDSPVGYWRLDETSGTTAKDSSGNGNNGTYSGGVTLNQQSILSDGNAAATFDGSSGYVEIPYNASLNPPIFSIEAWVKPTTTGTYLYVAGTLRTTLVTPITGYRLARLADGRWMFSIGDGTSDPSIYATSTAVNEYVHLIGTYDGARLRFYKNGVLESTSAGTLTLSQNTTKPLRIGAPPETSSNFFNGTIDDVAIYNRALTAEEVEEHYLSGIGDYLELDRTELTTTGTRTYSGYAWSGGDTGTGDIAGQSEGIGWLSLNCAGKSDPWDCDQVDNAFDNYAVTRRLDTLSGFAMLCPGDAATCQPSFLAFNCGSLPSADACKASDFKVTVDAAGEYHGWAWGDTIGWVSFNCADRGGSVCATSPYKVYETPTATGAELHGWAWSENYGWISFNCADRGGTVCATSPYKATTGLSGRRSRFAVLSQAWTIASGSGSPQNLTSGQTSIAKCTGWAGYFRLIANPPPARPLVQTCFQATYQGPGASTIAKYSTEARSSFQLR